MSVFIFCSVGENKAFYFIYPVTKSNGGDYYCKVQNQYGSEYSRSAVVTVTTSPTAQYSATESGVTFPTNLESQIQVITPLPDLQSK